METIRILLVDDEERFLETTGKLLRKKGFDVLTAASGFDALDRLAEASVHLVILDVKMPGMDGTETLREIKRRFPLVEVVMLTGHATMELAVEGLRSGAADFLMKPTQVEEIIQKAREAFDKHRKIEERIRVAGSKNPAAENAPD